MKRHQNFLKRSLHPLFCLLASTVSVLAEDNTTTVFGGGNATNLGVSLIIGDTGTNNVLVITNATRVNVTNGVLGNASSASFNSALVSDPGTIWTSRVFFVGATGSFNQVTITNGARMVSGLAGPTGQTRIGATTGSSNNVVVITGTNTSWIVSGDLRLGFEGGGSNQLQILNGAQVTLPGASGVVLGDGTLVSGTGGRNVLTISGSNSLLSAGGSLLIGRFSPYNQLIITNGGRFVSVGATYGQNVVGSNDTVIVTGANSRWDSSGTISIQRSRNVLQIDDGGSVSAPTNLLGTAFTSGTRDNLVSISGGTLAVTNAAGTGFYHIVCGTNLLNSGTLTVDSLLVTNAVLTNAVFIFNGGTFNTRNTIVSNRLAFVVGDGVSSATLNLQGGTHQFFNGLRINTNATLMGTGTIVGTSTTTVFGTLAPGNSPGILSLGNLTLASNSVYAVDLDGTTVGTQYDQVNVTGFVNLSNSLLSITLGYTPSLWDSFTIIDNDGTDPVQGQFLGLTNEAQFLAGGRWFTISYSAGTGNDVVLMVVPEPSALLFVAVASALLARRWRGSSRT